MVTHACRTHTCTHVHTGNVIVRFYLGSCTHTLETVRDWTDELQEATVSGIGILPIHVYAMSFD